jgi:hypothetical protein
VSETHAKSRYPSVNAKAYEVELSRYPIGFFENRPFGTGQKHPVETADVETADEVRPVDNRNNGVVIRYAVGYPSAGVDFLAGVYNEDFQSIRSYVVKSKGRVIPCPVKS